MLFLHRYDALFTSFYKKSRAAPSLASGIAMPQKKDENNPRECELSAPSSFSVQTGDFDAKRIKANVI